MLLILFLFDYLIGSFPSAFILTKLIAHRNILELGDHNVGARNVYHVLGKKIGLLTFILDGLKGYLIFLLSIYFQLPLPHLFLSIFFGWLGHCFPVWLKGKGGKGVALIIGFLVPQHLLSTVVSAIFFIPIKKWVKDFDLSYTLSVVIFCILVVFEKVSFPYFICMVLLFFLPLTKALLFFNHNRR